MNEALAVWHMARLRLLASQGDELALTIFEQTAKDVINSEEKERFFNFLLERGNAIDRFAHEGIFGFLRDADKVDEDYKAVWDAAYYALGLGDEEIGNYIKSIPFECGDEDPRCPKLVDERLFREIKESYFKRIENNPRQYALFEALMEREDATERTFYESGNPEERMAILKELARKVENKELEDVWYAAGLAVSGRVDHLARRAFENFHLEKVEDGGKNKALFDILTRRDDAIQKFLVEERCKIERDLRKANGEIGDVGVVSGIALGL
jgi:hypothetical protein